MLSLVIWRKWTHTHACARTHSRFPKECEWEGVFLIQGLAHRKHHPGARVGRSLEVLLLRLKWGEMALSVGAGPGGIPGKEGRGPGSPTVQWLHLPHSWTETKCVSSLAYAGPTLATGQILGNLISGERALLKPSAGYLVLSGNPSQKSGWHTHSPSSHTKASDPQQDADIWECHFFQLFSINILPEVTQLPLMVCTGIKWDLWMIKVDWPKD
jgi:hypothetical protein